MAKLSEGSRVFTGLIGPIVCSTWRGIPVLKTKPFPKNREATPAQLIQRAKFALASSTLRQFGDLFDTSFQLVHGKTGMNVAISHLLNQAISGEYPNLVIDHSQVLVAKGSLKKAEQAVVDSPAKGIISFNWDNNTGSGSANANDYSILVTYVEGEGAVYITNGAIRSAGQAQLTIPFFSGKKVHTWLSFRSPDGKLTADSVYTGLVEVA